MRIAIVGYRDFENYEFVAKRVGDFISTLDEDEEIEIVSGGASGVDAIAKQYAEDNGYTYVEFPAHWHLHGKSAGPLRNTEIVKYSDVVFAFPSKKSKGTFDTISKAKIYKKDLYMYEVD